MHRFLLTLLFLTAAAASAPAQVIVAWWTVGNSPDAIPGETSAAPIGATLFRGDGLTAATEFPDTYDAYGWADAPFFPGIGSAEFFGIELNIPDGLAIEAESLALAYSDAGSRRGPRQLELRWSGDGYAEPLAEDGSVGVYPVVDTLEASLNDLPLLTGTVQFRLYGYDSPGGFLNEPSALFGLTNGLGGPGPGPAAIVLRGQVIPEPSTLVLTGTGVAALVLLLRRRR
jgi:hypothetical protein